MYVCACVFMYENEYVYECACTCIYVYVCVYVRVRPCVRMYVCVFMCKYTCVYKSARMRMRVCDMRVFTACARIHCSRVACVD